MGILWTKLRIKLTICYWYLKAIGCKIVQPFQFASALIKRYRELRDIEEGPGDVWEKHARYLNLKDSDEFKKKRTDFFVLKTKCIGVFSRASISALIPEEQQEAKICFETDKKELVSLINQICAYPEINFDAEIKSRILSWEYGVIEQEELFAWTEETLQYINTLDILNQDN